MSYSRGIIKSTKQLANEPDSRKVQLVLHSSHKLIESDEQLEDAKVAIDERTRCKKRSRNERPRTEAGSTRSITGKQRSIKIRGCLKKEGSQKILDAGAQQEIRSAKSIKFNTKYHDVFEYTVTQKAGKKRSTKQIKQKVDSPCCQIY